MKSQQKYISITLISKINKLKKELQQQENIKKGRKAKTITFIEASHILAREQP